MFISPTHRQQEDVNQVITRFASSFYVQNQGPILFPLKTISRSSQLIAALSKNKTAIFLFLNGSVSPSGSTQFTPSRSASSHPSLRRNNPLRNHGNTYGPDMRSPGRIFFLSEALSPGKKGPHIATMRGPDGTIRLLNYAIEWLPIFWIVSIV